MRDGGLVHSTFPNRESVNFILTRICSEVDFGNSQSEVNIMVQFKLHTTLRGQIRVTPFAMVIKTEEDTEETSRRLICKVVFTTYRRAVYEKP